MVLPLVMRGMRGGGLSEVGEGVSMEIRLAMLRGEPSSPNSSPLVGAPRLRPCSNVWKLDRERAKNNKFRKLVTNRFGRWRHSETVGGLAHEFLGPGNDAIVLHPGVSHCISRRDALLGV